MSVRKITEEASEKKREEIGVLLDELAEIPIAPLHRLVENKKEAVGKSYQETAALILPGTIRGELRSKIRELECFLASNIEHICAKQDIEWIASKHGALLPKPGWMCLALTPKLESLEELAAHLRDVLFEAGAHSSANYGIGPAIAMAGKFAKNPLEALQSIIGQHPTQRESKKLDEELARAMNRYSDAVGALATELGNEFEEMIARILEQVRPEV